MERNCPHKGPQRGYVILLLVAVQEYQYPSPAKKFSPKTSRNIYTAPTLKVSIKHNKIKKKMPIFA